VFDCAGKAGQDSVFVGLFWEAVEVNVLSKSDCAEVLLPSFEGKPTFLICLFCDAKLAGLVSKSDVSQEPTSLGMGEMTKFGDICDGSEDTRKLVSSSFDILNFRDKASAIGLSTPGIQS